MELRWSCFVCAQNVLVESAYSTCGTALPALVSGVSAASAPDAAARTTKGPHDEAPGRETPAGRSR